jgi:DNA polymerase II large subunit
LRLLKNEEKNLIEHIHTISSYAQLKKLEERLYSQLGLVLKVVQRSREVRTARGIGVDVEPIPGLCKKTRQAIVTAVRRCLDENTEIVFAILDANDLFGTD